jgi:hypothetical protein
MNATYSISRQRTISHKKLVRLTVLLILMIATFSCGALVHAYAGGREEGNAVVVASKPAIEHKTVEVGKGDTLWKIAAVNAPKHVSTRDYVDRIMKLNHLDKPDLHVGQLLILP